MSEISRADYVRLRKKGQMYIEEPKHDLALKHMLHDNWDNLRGFLYQPLDA